MAPSNSDIEGQRAIGMTHARRATRAGTWRPSLVIFDCDGVLVDSERLAVRIVAQAIAGVGWAITEAEVIHRFVGRPERHMFEEIERRVGRPLGSDWHTSFRATQRTVFEQELTVIPGVVEVLEGLAEATILTSVASSSSHERIRFSLQLVGLLDRFEGRIFSSDDVRNPKPAPDIFLYAARSLGVDPSLCAVIEDSPYGVEAALAARMRAFGFAGGLTDRARLEGPDTVVFDDMRQLPNLLGLEATNGAEHS